MVYTGVGGDDGAFGDGDREDGHGDDGGIVGVGDDFGGDVDASGGEFDGGDVDASHGDGCP